MDYSSKIANSSWQLMEIQSKSNYNWVSADMYPEFGIKNLTFGAGGKFEICLHNYNGNQSDNTFYGDYSFSTNTIQLMENTFRDNFITITVKNLNDRVLDAMINLWGDSRANYSPDGNTVTHSRTVEHYSVRLVRVKYF